MANTSQLKELFRDLIKSGNLAQSYIFFGHSSSVEKVKLSRLLANFLETNKWAEPERLLNDVLFCDARIDGGIDLVRSASEFLWQKPAISSRRTLVITNAESLTAHAQSAILKIAEEPPASALIILLVQDPSVLLPAVQSRFQKIFIVSEEDQKFSNKETADFLKSSVPRRREIIKRLVDQASEAEDPKIIENFVFGLIAELRRDPVKNWQMLKKLLQRWTLMNDFNLNKRLQLEAALLEI